ncbi:MAG TPA: hypothetical protein VKU80_16330 [Planctomycetota bacterium]|nr:hypothetical protein [Planctomycetota bacterium]
MRGEIRNAGERSLDEAELKVAYLEADGKTPHWTDETTCKPGRACFSKTWPVLVNSALGGETVMPLKPKGIRAFSVDLPQSCNIENSDKVKLAFLGQITALRFSK